MARHAVLAASTYLLMASFLGAAHADSLRGSSETWRMLAATTDAPVTDIPLQERSFSWIQDSAKQSEFHVKSSGKIGGDQAILVFHDRTVDATAKAEAALVSFDVKSNANCVVSVCGKSRNWYMGSSEHCWGLKVAPKSSNPAENGVIRGISAAYTATRPAANKMYLKFDAVNYIDGSECEYEVLSGTKTVTTEPVAVVA
jgi:hypothetical protein